MNAAETPRRPRASRRKQVTRAALISAGQSFLAQGRTAVSIQEITDAADVGFGSFYNHFSGGKDELFAEAAAAALDTWGRLSDRSVEGVGEPAEVFAVRFRMAGRLQRRHPELVRVVLRVGPDLLVTERGLRALALEDLRAAAAAGDLEVPDPELAVALAGGAMLGLLRLLESEPDRDDAVASDRAAVGVLLMLGADSSRAHDLCARPLPPMPRLEDG